ncbi:MAG: hypothetical protein WBX15_21210 [Thermoanaerobaculia bacterium]
MKRLAILAAASFFVLACSSGIPKEEATKLIEQSKEFSEPAVGQIYTGDGLTEEYSYYASQMAATANGFIACQFPEGGGAGSCQLTAKGREASKGWKSEPYGSLTLWKIPTAHRQLKDVKTVNADERMADVEFTWDWEPTAFGRQSQQIPAPGPQPSRVRFRKAESGQWMIDRFTVGP